MAMLVVVAGAAITGLLALRPCHSPVLEDRQREAIGSALVSVVGVIVTSLGALLCFAAGW